jgi:hypothetical protein
VQEEENLEDEEDGLRNDLEKCTSMHCTRREKRDGV